MTHTSPCPCGSTLSYADCCAPLHVGQKTADTAAQLMRARYAAFVLQHIEYIVATTAPFQQALLDKKSIAAWSQQTDWAGLAVVKHTPKIGKRHAQVEFKAYFHLPASAGHSAGLDLAALDSKGLDSKGVHHELSTFVNIPTHGTSRWYFLDPTVVMPVTQKQPCPCGSGEKYKRCCGQFLA
ncbi:preprotein translocase subunit SecA [Moraxella osloensis]|nr:YchJ family protein [Moraxella osloensis]ATW71941.1 preprotein translocase subunit SecA [Moraxella osloensis]